MVRSLTVATDVEGSHLRIQAELFIKIWKKKFPGISLRTITGGTIQCTQLINSGKADIGQIKNWQYLTALKGRSPFTEKLRNLRAIMDYGSQGGVEHFSVSANSGIESFSDIESGNGILRLCTAREVTSSHHLTRLGLEAYSLDFDDLVANGGAIAIGTYPMMIDWMRKGIMNSMGGSSYLPCSWTVSLQNKIRLLSFDNNALNYLEKNYGMRSLLSQKVLTVLRIMTV